jgi:hypothetical protein
METIKFHDPNAEGGLKYKLDYRVQTMCFFIPQAGSGRDKFCFFYLNDLMTAGG